MAVAAVPDLDLNCPTWSGALASSRARVYSWQQTERWTYMGMEEKECECLTSSRSRDSSLSVEGIVV
jgi:hypothetical protein